MKRYILMGNHTANQDGSTQVAVAELAAMLFPDGFEQQPDGTRGASGEDEHWTPSHRTGVRPNGVVISEQSSALVWIKRGLVTAAIAGIGYGGVEATLHANEVEHNIAKHDIGIAKAIGVTEAIAWGSTPIMLGAAARRLGTRKIKFSDIPAQMRALEDSKTFQVGMVANMAAATGTTSLLIAGAESLPGSAKPLAYGVAAGSLALSSIPIKVAYMIDKRKQKDA